MRNTLYGHYERDFPGFSAGTAEEQMFYARQRVELERRAEFVRRYQKNYRESGVQGLDPVLRFHLGLSGRE